MPEDSKKILVVDDDADQCQMSKAILETEGYSVATASSETEALGALEGDLPDLLILDVMMEHLDGGFVLCQKVKADPRTRHIPVIMVTGIRETMPVDFSPGADGDYLPAEAFLEKPINPAVLLKKVKALLRV